MDIEYVIKRSRRAKHISLRILHDGTPVLTIPAFAKESVGIAFINKHQEWIRKKQNHIKTFTFLQAKGTRTEFLQYKNKALDLITPKVEHYSKMYGVNHSKISIRNQTTRWGSCSRQGNLSFNYKVVFLKDKLVNYLVVHEVCHLQQMNHSKKFWDLVAQAIPNYKELRTELQRTK
jgi:predicted metal-dependent hydrolase